MEALARLVEYYNHERLHEAIPQMGARTLSKKIGPTVPEDLTTYTRQKSLFAGGSNSRGCPRASTWRRCKFGRNWPSRGISQVQYQSAPGAEGLKLGLIGR